MSPPFAPLFVTVGAPAPRPPRSGTGGKGGGGGDRARSRTHLLLMVSSIEPGRRLCIGSVVAVAMSRKKSLLLPSV